VNHLLRRLATIFAILGSAIAVLTGLMTVTSVLGRALITQPIPGDVELTQFGIALAISLALPWCQLRNANIIVDFFTQKVSPWTRRLLDGVGAVLLAVMCLLLAWRTGVGAVAVKSAGEQTMILSLPMWWAYASLAPGLLLAAWIALWQAAVHLTGRDLTALMGEAPAVDGGASA
jgi:TRAP-type C4-dicarboxylate transport system permease small subunit